jgi:hypothetical protein
MPLNKSWHDYNESLIERGRVLIDVSFLKSSNKEIKKMNIGKVGAPFQYSDSYVRFRIHYSQGISYSTHDDDRKKSQWYYVEDDFPLRHWCCNLHRQILRASFRYMLQLLR